MVVPLVGQLDGPDVLRHVGRRHFWACRVPLRAFLCETDVESVERGKRVALPMRGRLRPFGSPSGTEAEDRDPSPGCVSVSWGLAFSCCGLDRAAAKTLGSLVWNSRSLQLCTPVP